MDNLIFIVVHHSSSEKDTELLINNIISIREHYKKNKIIIIKTSSSNIPFYILDDNINIYNKPNDLTFVIGVIPLLCEILNEDDSYILIHDSMYLINKLPENILDLEIYKLWDFSGNFDFSNDEFNRLKSIIEIEHHDILNDLYLNKYNIKWKGCFGPAFGGKVHFLNKINKILNIDKNMIYFEGRNKLMLSERILPLLIEYIKIINNDVYPTISINGSIFNHPNSFKKENKISINEIKKIVSNVNYTSYFYKLWFLRD